MLRIEADAYLFNKDPKNALVEAYFGEDLLIQAKPSMWEADKVTGYMLELDCGSKAALYLEGEHSVLYQGPLRTRELLMTGKCLDVTECLFRVAEMRLAGRL